MHKNISIHISDREHMNISLNIYHCGNMDVLEPFEKKIDYYIMYYVHEGNGSVTANDRSHRISRGSVFVVFPNTRFSVKSDFDSHMTITWIAFSGYMVERYLQRGGITVDNPISFDNNKNELEAFFINAIDVAKVLPNRYCKISACLYSIFALLLDNFYKNKEPVKYSYEYYLLRSLDYIDMHYNKDISIDSLSRHLGITRKHLYYVFKKLTEYSPKDYIINYRIREATMLLLDYNLTIYNVAIAVGYSNQFHFSKEFKKIVGKAPTEYRQIVKINPHEKYHSPIENIKREFIDTNI